MTSASRFLGAMVPFAHRAPIAPASASKATRVISKNLEPMTKRIGIPLQSFASPQQPHINAQRVKYANRHPQPFLDNGCIRSFKSISRETGPVLPNQVAKFTGIAATTYDLRKGPLTHEEIEFYRSLAQVGPTLVIGCGTGKVLLSLAEMGSAEKETAVDGIDPSEDMLALCRLKAQKHSLRVGLSCSSMEDFSSQTKYHNILVLGETFMSILDRKKALASLENVRDHLEPGGQLIIELLMPPEHCLNKQIESCAYHEELEQDYYKVSCNTHHLWNFIRNLRVERQRISLTRHGKFVKSQENFSSLKLYSVNEFITLLKEAGFVHIKPLRSATQPYGELKITFQAEKEK